MNDVQRLKGKRLRSVSRGKIDGRKDIPRSSNAYGGVFGQNTETITFHCEDGDYVFLADGDCCSQTYIESVEGPTSGLIIDVQYPEWGGSYKSEGDDEVKQFYKTTLVIEGQGHLDVEYRNDSNGYYGGSLSLLTAPEGK